MLVVGIDLSLDSTGLAIIENIDGEVRVGTATVGSTGKRSDSLAMRARRIASLVSDIMSVVATSPVETAWPDVALIEAPSYGSTGASSWDRAGLWWTLVTTLHDLGVPVAWAAPSTRMKYATGYGKGQDKAAVAAVAARLFPDTDIRNSDEADALIFAHMAAVHLGMLTGLVRHTECLKAVHWPESEAVHVG